MLFQTRLMPRAMVCSQSLDMLQMFRKYQRCDAIDADCSSVGWLWIMDIFLRANVRRSTPQHLLTAVAITDDTRVSQGV